MRTNETITLFRGNGLQVDVTRMTWDGNGMDLPTWKVLYFTAADIAAGLAGWSDNGRSVTFTEDDFEAFLTSWLEREFGKGHKLTAFRWYWDKVREFNAVA